MIRLLLISLCALALGGCATVTRGTTDSVAFESNPPGAQVTTSLGQGCITPCAMEFARNQSFSAQFNLEGFAPQSVDVATQIAGAGAAGMAGNLLLGGIVGAAVDASTGAANEHVPNPVFVDFMQIVSEPPIPGLASPSGTVVDGPASTPVS